MCETWVPNGKFVWYVTHCTFCREFSLSQIRSCRHGVRALDIADVSQRDWHPGQMIVTTNPRTRIDHAVFIDLAMVTQTWEPDEVNYLANCHNVFRILLGSMGPVGIDPELVWEFYDKPDAWHLGKYFAKTPSGGLLVPTICFRSLLWIDCSVSYTATLSIE